MDTSSAEIDPRLFAKENEMELGLALSAVALKITEADRVIAEHLRATSPETKAGLMREVEKLPVFQDIMSLIGGDEALGATIKEVSVKPESEYTEEQYHEAVQNRGIATSLLVDYVVGYQRHMAAGLRSVYDDEEQITARSWEAAWSKLVGTLKPLGGTTLAEIADWFDGLVRIQYAATYDPVHPRRGLTVETDPGARTFYDKLSPHLGRAILRSGKDSWTGH